jgi:hypothetical protein
MIREKPSWRGQCRQILFVIKIDHL